MNISIIIPTLNRYDDLHACLESLYKQSKKPYEILVIDQSDTIQTIEHSSIAIKHITMQEKSSSKAKNLGIKNLSTGTDTVIFLDDDTIIDTDCLNQIERFLLEHTESLGGLINMEYPTRQTNTLKMIGYFLLTGETSDKQIVSRGGVNRMFLHNPSEICTVERAGSGTSFYRKQVFDEGFSFPKRMTKYSIMEDVFFSYSIYKKYPDSLYFLPKAKLLHNETPVSRVGNKYKIVQHILHRFVFITSFGFSFPLYLYSLFIFMIHDTIATRSLKIIYYYILGLYFIAVYKRKIIQNKYYINEILEKML